METRDKVRILLFNPMGQILLMRIEDPTLTGPDLKGQKSCWITIGGSIEPGETANEAARREVHEETGLSDISIGAQVDYREMAYEVNFHPMLYKETYIAATTDSFEPDYTGWTEEERRNVKEMRWWSAEEVRATDEVIFPADLADIMRRALAIPNIDVISSRPNVQMGRTESSTALRKSLDGFRRFAPE